MVQIEKIIPGGQALGALENGKKIFFWNTLPGETVIDYKLTKNKSHFAEAVALKIISPSPHRVKPQDTCYLSTSPWQIIDYPYELELKQSLIVELFREQKIPLDTPEIFTDYQDYHYRNKMEYSLYWDNTTSQIALAFHARGSHRKIPINSSSIERPEIFRAATQIISELNSKHEEARRYQSLLLRCNQSGQVSGGLYENGRPHPIFPPLRDKILGRAYSYSPNGFFQINLPVYEMALKEIKRHIETDRVLDLYAGVGTIGLSVASDKHLTLVECDKSAYQEMTKNVTIIEEPSGSIAKNEQLDPIKTGDGRYVQNNNILAILSKSEDALAYIKPDVTVILDPPRAGCDKRLIDKLNTIKPPKIIYLSCNPATQARDVKLLLENYHLETAKTFNFFPRTPHIENLVVLSR